MPVRARLRVPLRSAAAGSIAAVLAVATAATAAPTKDQCIEANTQAQNLRRDGKFDAARSQLRSCVDAACPAIIRDDCTRRLDELEKGQPTIIFDAKDGAGHDLVAVKVTVDGAALADKLEGRALRIDAGAHTFTFTAADQPVVTQTFVIKEGEKDRRERVVIGPIAAPPPAPIPAATPPAALPSTPPEEAPSSGLGTKRILGIGVAGFGVGAVGVGAVFGLLASSAWSKAKTDCGGDTSHCVNVSAANSDKSTTTTDGTVSTVAFIAGGVLVAGGAFLFFTGKPQESAPAASFVVTPAFGPGQGGIAVHGNF
jgi:hypothetical protein